jgi:AcrR family transcriptional regulator
MAQVHDRDAAATRARILEAAAEEFGQFGIAGARVDRIAENASANKAMLYRYFGSKDDLFDAVFTAHVLAFADAVHFDASDLAGYAGRLFDSYQDRPLTLRLTHWYQLERPTGTPLQAIVDSNDRKLNAIATAQAAGSLPTENSPTELLVLVRGIAMSWNNLTPELDRQSPEPRATRRAAVVEAVRALTDARTSPSSPRQHSPHGAAPPTG